uniref:Sodium/solute symporter n=1 Tax=Corethron hystrix TaxID=216773 RepID=A0A6U5LSY6_9STRA|mmetsp:Transcript_6890/g.14861  ORF Transcript_6890/g.14861 Transcript_6890/m.14861 type:complete len:621 (+) Transcript_6890:80-1942(+)
MSFGDLDASAGYAVLYVVLAVFVLVALAAAGYVPLCGCLPDSRFGRFVLSRGARGGDGADEKTEAVTIQNEGGADFYLSARNSAGPWTLAMSYFASGMGAWVVYGSTEMGATPSLSWFGVLGYAGASAFPALIVAKIGPRIREISGEQAFSTSDFCLVRYGRVMQLTTTCISIFYMWIYLVSELTSVGAVYAYLVRGDDAGAENSRYSVNVILSMVVVTIFYTSVAGLPASIVTDKFQAIIMAVLVVLITVAVCAYEENRNFTKAEYAEASNWTMDGFTAAMTLFIAIACAEMFNQGTWQRVWAADSVSSMRKGFALGSAMVFFLMFFFGLMSVLAYANDKAAYDSYEKLAYLSFFDILSRLPQGWHILVLVLVTSLAASSIDTLQNALTSVFSKDIVATNGLGLGRHFGKNVDRWIARVIIIILNVPAIILASKKISVVTLFLVADLVCATAVLPVFLGLITQRRGPVPPPTEVGAFLGTVAGIATVLVYGQIRLALGHWNGAKYSFGVFIADGPWSYFWLPESEQCALCGASTFWTFVATVLSGGFFTIAFTWMHILAVGEEKAYRPILFRFGDGGGRYINDGEAAAKDGKNEGGEEANDAEEKPVQAMAMETTPAEP